MTTTKILTGIGLVALIGGAVVLVFQQRTIAELREVAARTQQQVATLASENAENVKARREAEKEVKKLRLEVAAAAKAADRDRAQASSQGVVAAVPVVGATSPVRVVADTAAVEKKKAQLHRRYDAFFQQRGLTAAQAERLVELGVQQNDAREDLQAAVETTGLRGDTNGIEAMRSKLYEPIIKEVREILGEEGYAAYMNYERTSFYRAIFVEPMSGMFSKINAPLSFEQTEQLVRALDANKQLRQVKPTDIGSAMTMNWDAVIGQMSGALTPAQVNVIRIYAERQKADKR